MCLSPLTLKRFLPDNTFRSVAVPCGKCVECLSAYQNQWALRLEQEAHEWKYLYFLTLTYNEKNVPFVLDKDTGECIRELRKSDLQLAIKRFREALFKKFGKRISFRYFGCGEYGTKTHRPHYHILFFMDKPIYALTLFTNDWRERYGHVDIKVVNTVSKLGVTKYVAKYAAKGAFEEHLVQTNVVSKPFRVMSKGIGFAFAVRLKSQILIQTHQLFPEGVRGSYYGYNKDYFEFLYSMKRIFVNGCCYNMPKYWYEYLFYKKIPYICSVADVKNRFYDSDLNLWLCPLKDKISYRYDKNSHFSLAFARFLLEKRDELYTQKFRELQALFPSRSASEIHIMLISKEEDELRSRGLSLSQKLAKFYLSSKM